jgi:NAD(P)-dependent dehydrogenase (short-subunit alcohol dehydrogenase family)
MSSSRAGTDRSLTQRSETSGRVRVKVWRCRDKYRDRAAGAGARSAVGRLNCLCVNAGSAEFRPIDHVGEAFFDRAMAANVRGGRLLLCGSSCPQFDQGGSIVFTTSVANQKGWPNKSVHAPRTAALRRLVRALARELMGRGIRVHTLAPDPIDTPIYGRIGLPPEAAKECAEGISVQVPLTRFGTVAGIAEAALFLPGPGELHRGSRTGRRWRDRPGLSRGVVRARAINMRGNGEATGLALREPERACVCLEKSRSRI